MIFHQKGSACRLLLCVLLMLLGACQNVPQRQHLSQEQIAALKAEGFEQSEDAWEFSASDRLLFGSNESALITTARQVTNRIGRLLVSLQIERIRVDGHTDATGSTGYNEQLSLRRATAVSDALIAAGVNAKSIQVRGLGQSVPVASNQTAEGRLQNRRVVIVIVSD